MVKKNHTSVENMVKKNHTSAEKDELISEFLLQEYVLPKLGLYRGRVLHFSPANKQGDTATVPKDHTSEQLCKDVCTNAKC